MIAIKAARAVPVTEQEMPQLYAVVRELTEKAGMPMPKLYVSQEMQPNAFATGRDPEHAAVAVTQGILRVLDWDELRAVLAHEISHVGNRDILITSVAAAVAMGITLIASFARFGAIFGGGGRDGDNNIFGILALSILAPHRRRRPADGARPAAASTRRTAPGPSSSATASPSPGRCIKIEQYAKQVPMDVNPAAAQAFIVNPLTGRKVQFSNLFRTHPPTEDRVRRLRERAVTLRSPPGGAAASVSRIRERVATKERPSSNRRGSSRTAGGCRSRRP